MKKLSSILGVAGVLALSAIAQAQEPPPGDPGAPPADVTVTTQTTTAVPADDTMVIGAEDPGTMPSTGGAPIAMALSGALTAAGAFFVRRKVS